MCGITGFWSDSRVDVSIAERMALKLTSRGPDDKGAWTDESSRLALAHRRLSILDLSSAGHQPMHSPCERFILVFNGEIYNHLDLRSELEEEGGNFDWLSHSDTETLLAGLRHWGLEKTLQKVNGMFAFVLWDKKERLLFMARDRLGEKPLYYGRSGNSFLFGSELKAMHEHPDWCGEINRDALALFTRYNYVPAPYSIYKGIFKLPPAHYIVIGDGGANIGKPQCYWQLDIPAKEYSELANRSSEYLIDELETLLSNAVSSRMISDVPIGAFLSGGYDSTIVAALMQGQSKQPIKTFTIGFHEKAYNEAKHAKAVAEHLGTDHTELYVTPEEAISVIPKLPTIYDEPFADSSQIPTFLISQLARRHVSVSLSGDGGDELFCGYNRYVLGYRIWSQFRVLPPSLRHLMIGIINRIPGQKIDTLQKFLPRNLRVSNLADRLPKFAEVLAHKDGNTFYRELVSHAKEPEKLVLNTHEPDILSTFTKLLSPITDLRQRMMYMDMMTYLPDDILTKVDRASMALSLEVRVPMLDHRLVEFAWRLPIEYKYRDGEGKWLLRQLLYRYVPKKLMDRPKMGFGVPIEYWLRGPLRDWAEELLNEERLNSEGYFDAKIVRRMWEENLKGERRWHYCLWGILMFQAWREHWM